MAKITVHGGPTNAAAALEAASAPVVEQTPVQVEGPMDAGPADVVSPPTQHSTWTVPQLRAALRDRGLDTSGAKPQLIARLERS